MGRQEALRPLELPLGRLPRQLTGAVVISAPCGDVAPAPPTPPPGDPYACATGWVQERNTPLGGCRVRSRARVRSRGRVQQQQQPHLQLRAPSSTAAASAPLSRARRGGPTHVSAAVMAHPSHPGASHLPRAATATAALLLLHPPFSRTRFRVDTSFILCCSALLCAHVDGAH
jgi:hypothetical protein